MQERAEVLKPILSLISKSEKALQKVVQGTWQHSMLGANVKALQIARALMTEGARFEQDELKDARKGLALMIGKTEQAQTKFAAGTSQHTLLKNRLNALRMAETRVSDAQSHANFRGIAHD